MKNEFVLFEDALNEYFRYFKLRNKDTSYKTITYRMNKYILPYFKDYNLFSITKKDYLNWQYYIESFNFKYNYKSSLHCCFSGFLYFVLYFII
ncbi:MAG: hypothetical protein J6K23_06395 [Bacilli bacterium]|nr:hypothetical protein [Bacilli bacterium]